MADPVIAAVGLSPFGRTDLPGRDLFSIAIAEAFDGLPDPAELVDAMYVGNQSMTYEHQMLYGTLLAEWCGLRYVPAERVEGCAAAGALALKNATRDVRNGIHDVVLAVGIEKMSSAGTGTATDTVAAAFDRAIDQRAGVTAPSQYALLAQRYLFETDATERDLAEIAVKNHRNGAANPRAQFQTAIDVDTVLDSDYIAPPLKLYDCAPISDGAGAVLVMDKEVATDVVPQDQLVRVAGAGTVANNIGAAERDLTSVTGARRATERAYGQAGVHAEDIDVAEVHDAFTICEALLAESAGFAPFGQGIESPVEPADRSDGWSDVHINTSGGLKARGHPLGATGIAQAVEVYEQLTETVTKDRQVTDAETGLLVNEGGIADALTVAHVLEAAA